MRLAQHELVQLGLGVYLPSTWNPTIHTINCNYILSKDVYQLLMLVLCILHKVLYNVTSDYHNNVDF